MKLRAAENVLVPPAFVALTRQKYVVPLDNPVALNVVEVNPLWFRRNESNVELTDICSVYESAPGAMFQLSVGLVEMPVAPFAGAASVGAVGAATIVVKVRVEENPPVPPGFDALTRQK